MKTKNGFILDDTTVITDKQLKEYKRIYAKAGEDAAKKYLEKIMTDW